MAETIPFPPQMAGTEAQRISQLYNYLFRVSQTLNYALQNIGPENMSEEYRQSVASSTAKQDQKMDDQYRAVKSIVIKTANIIRSETDQLLAQLAKTYVAKSEFGAYDEAIKALIQATADGIVQNYNLSSVLTTSDPEIAGFREWKITSDQYIHSGLLYYDEENLPVFGVAVGNNLTYVEVDGVKTVKKENLAATFTAEKVSFWQGGREAAYLSNKRLYVLDAEFLKSVQIGKFAFIPRANGNLSFMKVVD